MNLENHINFGRFGFMVEIDGRKCASNLNSGLPERNR